MFSKELEDLIQASLEDGVLEDYEETAIQKRAQAEGVDPTELKIYINSLLQKREKKLQKSEKNQIQKEELKQNKSDQVSSVKSLLDKMEAIILAPMPKDKEEIKMEKAARLAQLTHLVDIFPLPSSNDEVLDFLSLSASKIQLKGGFFFGTEWGRKLFSVLFGLIVIFIFEIILYCIGDGGLVLLFFWFPVALGIIACKICLIFHADIIDDNKIAKVWRSKFEKVIKRGRSMNGNDEFTQQLDFYEGMLKKK